MGKESFILYKSSWKPISTLSNEQLGRLLRAIFSYQCGESFEVGDDISMAFSFIKTQMDIDTAKYEAICKSRGEAGRQGMQARWGVTFDNTCNNDNKSYQKVTSITENDNECENENENVNDNVCVCENESSTHTHTFDFLYVIFFRNILNAQAETERFVKFYESTNWTLQGGQFLDHKMRVAKASNWKPATDEKRFPQFFLNVWKDVLEIAPIELRPLMLHDRVKFEKCNDKAIIHVPEKVAEWMLGADKSKVGKILTDGRIPYNGIRLKQVKL